MKFNCSLNLSYENLDKVAKEGKYIAIFLYSEKDDMARKFLRERGEFINSKSGNIDFYTYVCEDIFEENEESLYWTRERLFEREFGHLLDQYEPKHDKIYDNRFDRKKIYKRMSYIAATFYGGGKFPSLVIYNKPNDYICFNLSNDKYFKDFDDYTVFIDGVLSEIQKCKEQKLMDMFSTKKKFIISSKYPVDDYNVEMSNIEVLNEDKEIKEYLDYLIEKSGVNYEYVRKRIKEDHGKTVNFANYSKYDRKPTKEILAWFGIYTKSSLDEINYLCYLCGYSSLNFYRSDERRLILEILNSLNISD